MRNMWGEQPTVGLTHACVQLPYVVRVVEEVGECCDDIHEFEYLMLHWIFLPGGPVMGVGCSIALEKQMRSFHMF